MDAIILDTNYDMLCIIDRYESFIWSERYNECGDFELTMPTQNQYLDSLKLGNYVANPKSERLMIIEGLNFERNSQYDRLIVTGRSLESILDRRIVWSRTDISGNLGAGLKKIIEDNCVNGRPIPGFEVGDCTLSVSSDEPNLQGENIYDLVADTCQAHNVGFKILPVGKGGFKFDTYVGLDHSYDQDTNPYVLFSTKFGNLNSSRYYRSNEALKTVCFAVGEVEVEQDNPDDPETKEKVKVQKSATVSEGASSGLERREIFTSVSLNDPEEGEDVPDLDAYYNKQLTAAARDILAENKAENISDGEINPFVQYIYGEDYKVGDIVQVINDYGGSGKARVSEVVLTHDSSGETAIASFTFL